MFNEYPYTDLHNLNLDWFLDQFKKIGKHIEDLKKMVLRAPDATNANAGQAPIADGEGGWEWGDVQMEVDSELSDTSTNPVQNKVVYEALNEVNGRLDDVYDVLAISETTTEEVTGTEYEGIYLKTNGTIGTSRATNIMVLTAHTGEMYEFKSNAYSVAGGAPAIALSDDPTPAVPEPFGEVLAYASSSSVPFSCTYTVVSDCYIYVVQHPVGSVRGRITITRTTVTEEINEDFANYSSHMSLLESHCLPLKGKKIAVIGDSIMQYMSGGYGGSNVQTFVENGNSHTYDELTIENGIPYYNGNVCTVVNEKQSYYDAQGWELLKSATGAGKILNCSIGGSGIKEGTLVTDYPGYENGTHHTNSLPNLVNWLFRMCENESDPDLVVIWIGTNLIGGNEGDIETVFTTPWETLSSPAAGHTIRQTTIGALRYALERIYREMPNTDIMLLGPIQADTARFSARTYTALKSRSDAMKSVSDRISVKFFEPLTEIGIYGPADTSSDSRYLRDGLHPNEDGQKLLTRYLNGKIVTNYLQK